jgi:hypothetical protein
MAEQPTSTLIVKWFPPPDRALSKEEQFRLFPSVAPIIAGESAAGRMKGEASLEGGVRCEWYFK